MEHERSRSAASATAIVVTSIERTTHGVVVGDSHGRSDSYDHVVIASHSDQALAMLADPSPLEHAILGAIPYRPNRVVLHRDPRLMPKRRAVSTTELTPSFSASFTAGTLREPASARRSVIVPSNFSS